jgi:hypothetical protein
MRSRVSITPRWNASNSSCAFAPAASWAAAELRAAAARPERAVAAPERAVPRARVAVLFARVAVSLRLRVAAPFFAAALRLAADEPDFDAADERDFDAADERDDPDFDAADERELLAGDLRADEPLDDARDELREEAAVLRREDEPDLLFDADDLLEPDDRLERDEPPLRLCDFFGWGTAPLLPSLGGARLSESPGRRFAGPGVAQGATRNSSNAFCACRRFSA